MGMGTGGPSQLGQKSGVVEAEVHQVIQRALGLGINIFDTAAAYGESEAILGRALRGTPRSQYVLCTKVTPARRSPSGPDRLEFVSEKEVEESCDRSLSRLQTNYIDVLQFHAVIPETYSHVRDTLYPVAKRLQDQGKVRFIGLTEAFAADHNRQTLRLALNDDIFDTLLVGYNLMTPGPEDDIFPAAQRQDVGVMVMCAVRRKIAHPPALEALLIELKREGSLPALLPDRDPLGWLVHDDVRSVVEAAYKFAAGHSAVSTVLTGTASSEHLTQNVEAVLGTPMAATDRQRLKRLFGPVGRKLGD